MLILFQNKLDMNLQCFSSVVIKKLLDECVAGVVSERIFFERFLLTRDRHKVPYARVHRTGGLSLSELSRLIECIFETNIAAIEIDYFTVIARSNLDFPIYADKSILFDCDNFDFSSHEIHKAIAEYLLTDLKIIDYAHEYTTGELVLSDGCIRTYPANSATLDRVFTETRRFMLMSELKKDIRVTGFRVMLENEYSKFEIEEEELNYLF